MKPAPAPAHLAPPRLQPVEVALPPAGVFVLESRHGDGFRMEPSCHDFWELFFVLGGAGEFVLDGESLACAEDDVIVVPPGMRHQIRDRSGAPLALYGLCLADAWVRLDPAAPVAGKLELPRDLLPGLRSGLRRLLFEQSTARPGARYLLVGRALALLGLMTRGQLAAQARAAAEGGLMRVMRDYLAELHERFFEASDIDSEAARLRMSRRRFTQLFRELAGCSWLEQVTALRVGHAQHLLSSTRRSVTAIAFECGFEELSSFYRAFKKTTGMAPLEWRERGLSKCAG